MDKPFYKTSEFYLTLAVIVGAIVALCLGKITTESAMVLISSGLAIGGYAISRGLAKTGSNDASKIVLVFLLSGAIVSGSACGLLGGKSTASSLEKVHQATMAVHSLAEPAFHFKCGTIAKRCGERGDEACPEFFTCSAERNALYKLLQAIQLSVIAGLAADASGNVSEAAAHLARAAGLLGEVYALAKKHGILMEAK